MLGQIRHGNDSLSSYLNIYLCSINHTARKQAKFNQYPLQFHFKICMYLHMKEHVLYMWCVHYVSIYLNI